MAGMSTNWVGLGCRGFCDEAASKNAITAANSFEV
jgi:hypothetical protein